jgi:acetolactate synthase regulatory subunit
VVAAAAEAAMAVHLYVMLQSFRSFKLVEKRVDKTYDRKSSSNDGTE